MSADAVIEAQSSVLAEASALANAPAPEAKPFDGKYEAREALVKQCGALEECLKHAGDDVAPLLRVLIGELDGRLGEIATDVEEPHVAEPCLTRALDALAPGAAALDDADPEGGEAASLRTIAAASVATIGGAVAAAGFTREAGAPRLAEAATRALNGAAILWHQREQPRRALRLLGVAEASCLPDDSPKDAATAGKRDADTKTLFFLAQVHAALGDGAKSAAYCARTLERQIEGDGSGGVAFDTPVLDWATNAAGLAKYYAETNDFRRAQACCRAASGAVAAAPDGRRGDDATLAVGADIAKIWATLHLGWLRSAEMKGAPAPGEPSTFRGLAGPTVDLRDGLPPGPPRAPADYEDVKRAVLAALHALKRASTYYVLDGFVTEHVDIALLTSRAYKFAMANDDDHARRQAIKMKRVELLDPIRSVLTAGAYRDLRATLAFEIAQVLMSALDDKADRLERYDEATQAKKRVLCEALKVRAVAVYDDFLRQCVGADQKRADDHPDAAKSDVAKLDAADVEAYLLASFYAARLAGKRWVSQDNLDHARESLARYRKVEKDAAEARATRDLGDTFFSEELKLVQEMVKLLPSKIALVQTGRAP